jgi:hypothetical protein
MFWKHASDYCENLGMPMASLKSKPLINAATIELKKQGSGKRKIISIYKKMSHFILWFFSEVDHFWLSASDAGRTAGVFAWGDGTPVDESTWYPGYPKNFKAGSKTCVYLATGESTIYDVTCEAAGILGPYALCQMPPTCL